MITSVASLVRRGARIKLLVASAGMLVALVPNAASGFQSDTGRETPPPPITRNPPNNEGKINRGSAGSSRESRSGKVNKPQLANLTIIAPTGCRIWINGVEIDNLQPTSSFILDKQKIKASLSNGMVTLKGLKPGPYQITARKQDFREYMRQTDVLMGQENVFSIGLVPLPAKLTVSPSIGGSEVEVLNLDSGTRLGRYFHSLDQIELTPGRYRITTSKSGYRLSMREVTARAGESIYLEPSLEPMPTPTPTPIPTPRIIPMTFNVQKQDKFLILRLHGSSGDVAKTIGSINVTMGGPSSNYVNGNFNGLPCQVEFIKLENVAEGSIVEAPGPSNNWSSIIVRVRPKDEKRRPISFAINWSSLTQRSFVKPGSTPDMPSVFVPAVVTQKIQPNFPSEARGSAINGTDLVNVIVDSMGSVISAKAIQGPYVFEESQKTLHVMEVQAWRLATEAVSKVNRSFSSSLNVSANRKENR